jgi:RNA polymerase sigma-70 factor (ECF subfamily)
VNSVGSTTSLTLLERAKQNDQQAWGRLVKLYSPLVYRLCRVSQVQASDSRDIVQDVFRSVFANIDRFRRDRPGDSFRAWLLTITKNKIRDYFRARERHIQAAGGTDMQRLMQQLPALDWDASRDGSSFDSRSNVMRRVLGMVRSDFEERTWQAFWMTTIEGHEVVDVAEQLGISKWSVYQAKSRILGRMRDELDGLTD